MTRAPRHSTDHAEISSQACDDYLTRIAPVLHGSLHSILGWAETRPNGMPNDVELDRAASAIIRQAHQQSWILHELMEVWRASGGELQLDPAPLIFGEMIDRALWAVQPISRTASVRIARQVDASAAQTFVGDERRLTQAVLVLLCHAIAFAPAGGIVIVHAACAQGVAELSISDERSNAAPADSTHAVDRRPPHEAMHARAPSGLSLSFVRNVVTSHHGRLIVHAASAGPGAAFRVRIPSAADTARAGVLDLI